MIRRDEIAEHLVLNEIAFSKQTRDYSGEYSEIWKDELTITLEYIYKNAVFVFQKNKSLCVRAGVTRHLVPFCNLQNLLGVVLKCN